jgi:hypothetical protein
MPLRRWCKRFAPSPPPARQQPPLVVVVVVVLPLVVVVVVLQCVDKSVVYESSGDN